MNKAIFLKQFIILFTCFGVYESVACHKYDEIPDEFGRNPFGTFYNLNISSHSLANEITPQDLQGKVCDLSYRDLSCSNISQLNFANTPVKILNLSGNNPALSDEFSINSSRYPIVKQDPASIELFKFNRKFILKFVRDNCEMGKTNLEEVIFPENLIPLDLQNSFKKNYSHIKWKF